MRRTTTLSSWRLLLTAVAVLSGILGMHAASGGAHAPRGGEHAMTSPDADVLAMGAVMVENSVQDVAAGTAGALLALAPPGLPTEAPSAMAALAAMCVAMLLSLAVLHGLRVLRRSGRAATPPSTSAALSRRRELTRAPPPDLLTRLCVLRT